MVEVTIIGLHVKTQTLYVFYRGYIMKKALFSLTLVTLAVGSATAYSDFIEKAIEKGRVDVIKTCIRTDYKVTEAEKLHYINGAQVRLSFLSKNSISLCGSLKTSELLSLGVSVIAIGALAKASYDEYIDEEVNGKYMAWKSTALFTLGVTKGLDTLLKFFKDVNADTRSGKIKKAQSVLVQVKLLPVITAAPVQNVDVA